MSRAYLILSVLSVVFFGTCLRAADVSPLPPDAQVVVDRFVTDGAKLVSDSETKRTASKEKLDAALEAVQVAEGKAGRLEGAVAVQQLRADVTAGKAIDASKPGENQPKAAVRQLEYYESEIAKIDKDLTAKMVVLREQAIKDLDVVKVAQTKDGALDVALIVKQAQDQLRSGQPAAQQAFNVLVIGKGGRIEPADQSVLRRGGAESTIEVVLTAIVSDGIIFRCGAGGKGQSMALMHDELWYAVGSGRKQALIKAPLNGAKPPLHLAVTFAKGDVTLWVNGVPAKHEKLAFEAIGNNPLGGGVGDVGEIANIPAMPRVGFTGELASFRYADRALYTAPFKVAFPLVASDAIRWQIDVQTAAVGPLKELPKAHLTGELSVKR